MGSSGCSQKRLRKEESALQSYALKNAARSARDAKGACSGASFLTKPCCTASSLTSGSPNCSGPRPDCSKEMPIWRCACKRVTGCSEARVGLASNGAVRSYRSAEGRRSCVTQQEVRGRWTEGERAALAQRVCSATCSLTRPGGFVAMRLFALWTAPCVSSDALATCSRLLRFVFCATPARVSLLRKHRRNVMHGILKSRAQAMSPRRSCLLSAHTGKPD